MQILPPEETHEADLKLSYLSVPRIEYRYFGVAVVGHIAGDDGEVVDEGVRF